MKSALPKTASFHSKHSFIAARFFRRRAQHKLGNTSEISEATLQYPPPLPILIALKMHTTSSHYGVFPGQSTKYLKINISKKISSKLRYILWMKGPKQCDF